MPNFVIMSSGVDPRASALKRSSPVCQKQ